MKTVKKITWNDETHTLKKWEDLTGISAGTIGNRISYGWSADRALSTTMVTNRKKPYISNINYQKQKTPDYIIAFEQERNWTVDGNNHRFTQKLIKAEDEQTKQSILFDFVKETEWQIKELAALKIKLELSLKTERLSETCCKYESNTTLQLRRCSNEITPITYQVSIIEAQLYPYSDSFLFYTQIQSDKNLQEVYADVFCKLIKFMAAYLEEKRILLANIQAYFMQECDLEKIITDAIDNRILHFGFVRYKADEHALIQCGVGQTKISKNIVFHLNLENINDSNTDAIYCKKKELTKDILQIIANPEEQNMTKSDVYELVSGLCYALNKSKI